MENNQKITSTRSALLLLNIGAAKSKGCQSAASALRAAAIQRFPDCAVDSVFMSRTSEKQADPLKAAIDQAAADGIRRLVVQPAFLTYGQEYRRLEEMLQYVRKPFTKLTLGEPLLTSDADQETVADAVIQAVAAYDTPKTAICLVGHGCKAGTNEEYSKMQRLLEKKGRCNYFVGTLRARPSLEDAVRVCKARGYERVVLRPFMIAAGNHACRDIAGDGEGTWKRGLEQAGYPVICIREGLCEIAAVRDLFIEHMWAAMDQPPVFDAYAQISR